MSELIRNVDEKIDEIKLTKMGRDRMTLISEIISKHDWETSVRDEKGELVDGQNILSLLLYQYGLGIEKITRGQVSFEKVMKRLEANLGKLRLGPWTDKDSDVMYERYFGDPDAVPVTSEEYKKRVRTFGAHKCEYFDQEGNYKTALALLRIDFNDIDDVRHTLFHELTHVLATVVLNEQDFQEEKVQVQYENEQRRIFVNGEQAPNGQYIFNGLSTFEQLPRSIIKHNGIDEGFVEGITKRIIAASGISDKFTRRYKEEVDLADLMIDAIGTESTISMYLMNSHILMSRLENTNQGDLLHKISELLIDNARARDGLRELEEKLPRDVYKSLEKHPFFSYQEYNEESRADIEDYKRNLRDAIEKLYRERNLEPRSINIEAKFDDIDIYVKNTNEKRMVKEAFLKKIEQKKSKGHEQKRDENDI